MKPILVSPQHKFLMYFTNDHHILPLNLSRMEKIYVEVSGKHSNESTCEKNMLYYASEYSECIVDEVGKCV